MFSNNMSSVPNPSKPPSKWLMLGESRLVFDVVGMAAKLAVNSLQQEKPETGRTVIMLPGFGSDDRYMEPLGKYLRKQGYAAEGWGLGFNRAGSDLPHTLDDLSPRWNIQPKEGEHSEYKGEAGVAYLCDLAIERIKARVEQLDSKVTLLGWSLGGYIAREVARDLADEVDQVITLGSPVVGGPKYTAAAPFFNLRGHDLNWVEREIAKREDMPISQPITAIYSKSDAIVDWRASIDRHSPNVKHIKVSAPHLGLGFNPQVWGLVLAELDKRNSP